MSSTSNPGSRQALAGIVTGLMLIVATLVAVPAAYAAASSPPGQLSTVDRNAAVLAAKAQAATLQAQTPITGAVTVKKKKAPTTRALKDEGVIRVTLRVCGNARNWKTVAAVNHITASSGYLVLLGQKLSVPCDNSYSVAKAPTSKKVTKPAVKKKKVTKKKAPPRSWVTPLRGKPRGVSCWGASRDGGHRSHKGVDLPAAGGTRIRAAHAGKIVRKSYQVGRNGKGAGYYVVVSHGNGLYTVYMHMRRASFLKIGTHVSAGQTIGYVGDSGAPGAYHLHFEVHRGLWHQVNPAPFMRARGAGVGC